MGLGKTLEMIALIVSDMNSSAEKKTTLIVAPLGIMSNWSGQARIPMLPDGRHVLTIPLQIAHHVHQESPLRVLTYHGAGKKQMGPEDFSAYDVVITTYGLLLNH